MSAQHFYLELEAELSGALRPELELQQLLCEVGRQLFGECGAPCADVLLVSEGGRRALLRVHAEQRRRLRAALALSGAGVRVRAEAPSLQALV